MGRANKFYPFFYLKIYISMIYKEKIQGLIEALNGKLRVIEGATTGAMRISNEEVYQIIQDSKKLTERISELISVER
jgi:hypothetical protein